MPLLSVLVTGSRYMTADPTPHLDQLIGLYPDHEFTLTHGKCPTGADPLTAEAASKKGWKVFEYEADWSRGRSGGPIRNQQMVNLNHDLTLAFLYCDSKGTLSCLKQLAKFSKKPNSKLQLVLLVTETTSEILSPSALQQRFN